MADLSRIESNIRLMIDKGAPVSDIDAYLKEEGHTPESFKAAIAQPSTAEKAAGAVNTGVNWLGTQLTKGVAALSGTPAAIGDLAIAGGQWAGDKVGAPELGRNIGAAFKNQLTFHGIQPSAEILNNLIFGKLGVPEVNAGDNPALTLTNPLGIEGKVNVGKMMDVGAQAIPGSVALGGGVLPAILGGATSEAAGQATEGKWYEPLARLAGSVPGAYAGARLQTPLPASLTPEQQRLVNVAREKGMPLTVGQETGRGRGIESAVARFPTSQGKMAEFNDVQQTAINRDLLKRVNIEGERMDPESMGRVLAEGNRQFNAARNNGPPVKLDDDFYSGIANAEANYRALKPISDRAPIVSKKVDDFLDTKLLATSEPNPTLTSDQYQAFRKSINDAIALKGDPATNHALKSMREALDDAMERSGTPQQAKAWREARENWANLKILTKAASHGTADSRSTGNVTPGSLVSALRQRQGDDRFATTMGGMNDTARLASYLADTRPNSGTPQTLAMQSMVTGGPIAGGYVAGGVPGALAAGAMMAAPNVAARAMTGQGWLTPAGPAIPIPASLVRRYLANQSLPNTGRAVAAVPGALTPDILQREKRSVPGLLN